MSIEKEYVRRMVMHKQYVATGYIYDREQESFLFILHKKLGKWLPPGGHLHEGEEPHNGMLREVREETGVEGRILNLLKMPEVATRTVEQLPTPFCMLSEIIPAGPNEDEHVHIDFVYVVEIDFSEPLYLCQEEVALAKWVSSEKVEELDTYENVKQVCRSIRASIISQREREIAQNL